MNSTMLRPIEHVSISDRAYSVLRESILHRTFLPGQQLDLEQLESQLGVSRTPLKEALTRLAMEDLVTISPRRGTYVTELNPEDIAQRFDLRCFLEIGAAEQIVKRMTPERLAKMHALADKLDAAVTPDGDCPEYESYIEGDREFHNLYIEAAGNRLLNETYDSLNVHIYVVRVVYSGTQKGLDRVNQEHREFLHVLEKRDVAGVRQATAKHMENSKHDILTRMPSNA